MTRKLNIHIAIACQDMHLVAKSWQRNNWKSQMDVFGVFKQSQTEILGAVLHTAVSSIERHECHEVLLEGL